MTETIKRIYDQRLVDAEIKTTGDLVHPSNRNEPKTIKISGTLTSQVQLRGEGTQESYYYSFIRLKGQSIDLPVIFKIKEENNKLVNPPLKKSDSVELTGQ